jgi:hypothetical protein
MIETRIDRQVTELLKGIANKNGAVRATVGNMDGATAFVGADLDERDPAGLLIRHSCHKFARRAVYKELCL